MKWTRIGIIGLGIGEKHLEGIQSQHNVTVTALCDFAKAKQDFYQTKMPDVRFYTDSKKLIEDPEVDVVCIASYDDQHYEQIMQCIDAGKHIFCEKPVCQTPEEAFAIAKALQKNPQLRFSCNFILRQSPRFAFLEAEVQAGRLGQIFAMEGDYNYGRLHKITEGWRGKRPFYSAIYGGGIHIVDLFVWLLKSDPIVEVMTYGNAIASQALGTQLKFKDMTYSILKTQSGVVLKLGVNFGCHYPHFHRFSVYGTEGSFEHDLSSAYVVKGRDTQAKIESIDLPYPGTHKSEIFVNFVRSIQGLEPQQVTGQEVFDGLAVCFALERSLESGQPEKVERSLCAA